MNRRVAVRAIVLDNDRLLCVRLTMYSGSTQQPNEFWCLPGGGVDPGESLVAALHREMTEETGIEPHIGGLLYVQQFLHGGTEHMEFFFHVTNTDDYRNIDLSATTHGTLEIAEIKFIDPTATYVLPKFLASEPLAAHAAAAGAPKFFAYLQ